MKIVISLKKLHNSSNTRGIGVYARELVASLQKSYPQDQIIPTSDNPGNMGGDLIHYPYFDPFFLTLEKPRKIPFVVTIHDLIPLKFASHFSIGIRGKLKWFFQKRLVKQANHIITDSASSKQDIISIIGVQPSRVSVIPLGPNKSEIVPTKLTKKIKDSYHLPAKYLLYVGDLNWNKNVVGLIHTFSALKDKNLHLVLIGKIFVDKPPIPEYLEVAKAIECSGKSAKIICLGYIPAHHLSVIYSSATLYVQPSWYEGFGLPILEAMKFGCPVATSNRGSLPEIGGDAVAYFNPQKNMTETIKTLLNSPSKLTTLSEQGKLQAQKFTWANTARLTHQVYEKLLAK